MHCDEVRCSLLHSFDDNLVVCFSVHCTDTFIQTQERHSLGSFHDFEPLLVQIHSQCFFLSLNRGTTGGTESYREVACQQLAGILHATRFRQIGMWVGVMNVISLVLDSMQLNVCLH